jgi:hypothetical protein
MTVDAAQLDELFARAVVQTEPGARAAFLDHSCQNDPGLRDRLEALLAAHSDPARKFDFLVQCFEGLTDQMLASLK